jgi:hypothetical protein
VGDLEALPVLVGVEVGAHQQRVGRAERQRERQHPPVRPQRRPRPDPPCLPRRRRRTCVARRGAGSARSPARAHRARALPVSVSLSLPAPLLCLGGAEGREEMGIELSASRGLSEPRCPAQAQTGFEVPELGFSRGSMGRGDVVTLLCSVVIIRRQK